MNDIGNLAESTDEPASAGSANMDLILDIPLTVQVHLGETRLPLRDVLNLNAGSILRLNKNEGDPVELSVNGKLIATGDIVTTPEGAVAVRVTSIVTRMERIRSLR